WSAGAAQPTQELVVDVFADLPAYLPGRKPIGGDVCVDCVGPDGRQQRVEAVLACREPLRGERQDLRGGDDPADGSGGTRAGRSARSHGRRGGGVHRLAQPYVDRSGGVLLAEVEVRL